jgi:hypothetical protein
MKNVIVILLIVGAAFGTWRYYKNTEGAKAPETEAAPATAVAATITEDQLPRMHDTLETSLIQARQRGAYGLRQWLSNYGNKVSDPRLAWVQLDYVILVGSSDLGEARRIFEQVKKRIPETSVIYPRIKKLEPSYGTPRA